MDNLNKKDFFILAFILCVGALLRGIPLLLPYYTTDQAGIPLQAWNILQGEWPIFYYGQAFQGTLEGYLCAIFFKLFAPNWDLATGLLCIFSSLFFLIFFFFMTKEIFSKKLAFIALLLVTIAPPYLLLWGHDPRLHYSFIFVFQSLLFWMTAKYLKQPFSSISRPHFFLFGLICGLAWWTNFLNIHTLFMAGLFLLIKEPKTLLKRLALPGVIGFIIGSLPVWIFNATHEFISFQGSKFVGASNLIQYAPTFFSDGLAYAFGLYHDFNFPHYSIALMAGMIILILSLIYFFFFEKTSFLKGKGLLIGYFVSTLIITCSSVFADGIGGGGLYLIGLIPIIAIAIGSFALFLNTKTKIVGTLIILFFLGNSIVQNLHHEMRNLVFLNPAHADWVHRYNHSNNVLFETLRKKEIKGAYKDSDEIFKLKYLGEQKIYFSDFYQDNYPPDAEKVDGSEKIAFVLRGTPTGLSESLAAMKVDYLITQLPDYLLFSDFSLKENQWEMIDRSNWKGISSLQKKKAHLAFDGKATTRWSTDRPKEKGIWVQVDMGKTEEISRLSIHPGNWQDYPNGLSIKVSQDRSNWQEVLYLPQASGPFFWDGTHPFYRIRRTRIDFHFDPVQARYIHIANLNKSKRYFWSIMELYAYKGTGKIKDSEFVTASDQIIKQLKDKNIEFVAADHWLSARIKTALKKKIQTYPSNLFTGINRQEKPDTSVKEPLFLTNKTALIVTFDKETETDKHLSVKFKKEKIGPYILYTNFKQKNLQPLYWAGDHLLEL